MLKGYDVGMAKVILDAGHGGTDSGAIYKDRTEKVDNLELTLSVGELLNNYGMDVFYTRMTDKFMSPGDRVHMVNQEGGDLFISIHRNSSVEPNMYSGVQTHIYNRGGLEEVVAEKLNTKLNEAGLENLGVNVRSDMAILKGSEVPAVLIQVGFVNTDTDNEIFDQNFEEIAQAIAKGVIETVGNETEQESYRYRVQVGLFRNYNNAMNLHNRLLQEGLFAVIVTQGEFYAVHVGDFACLDDAAEFERVLRSLGYSTLLVAV